LSCRLAVRAADFHGDRHVASWFVAGGSSRKMVERLGADKDIRIDEGHARWTCRSQAVDLVTASRRGRLHRINHYFLMD